MCEVLFIALIFSSSQVVLYFPLIQWSSSNYRWTSTFVKIKMTWNFLVIRQELFIAEVITFIMHVQVNQDWACIKAESCFFLEHQTYSCLYHYFGLIVLTIGACCLAYGFHCELPGQQWCPGGNSWCHWKAGQDQTSSAPKV